MEQDIIKIIKDTFPANQGEITSDTLMEDVVSDSMDFIELVAVLSSKYTLEQDTKKLSTVKTVGDLLQHISPKDAETMIENGNLTGF